MHLIFSSWSLPSPRSPRTFTLAFRPSQLPGRQVGYSIDAEGNALGGPGTGDWKPSWLVIGSDSELGDPLIVDLSSPKLGVIIAAHGVGRWEPIYVSDSLMGLLKAR